jgi:hypothetical protein
LQKERYLQVKAWLVKHNLPTEVIQGEYDELNQRYKSIRLKEIIFLKINKEIKQKFSKLDKE